MKITGKHTGPVEEIKIPKNKENGDGQQAIVKLAIRVSEDECRAMCGDEFTDGVAFAGLVKREDEDGGIAFAHINDGKPTKDLVMEMHDVLLFGLLSRGVQPKIRSRGVEREPKVDLLIDVPIPIGTSDKADLELVRSGKVGVTHKVEFIPHPSTEPLPFKKRKGKAAAEPQPTA